MEKGIYTVVFVAFAMILGIVKGCSEFQAGVRFSNSSETDTTKTHFSEVVVFGRIGNTVTGKRYPFRGVAGVSTVEFQVLCSYKGGTLPSTIYIGGLGNANGQIPNCPAVKIDKETPVIMFLKRTGRNNVFEVEFRPNFGDPSIVLDDLTINCGLQVGTVEDVENVDFGDYDSQVCEDYLPLTEDEGCLKWKPPKTTPAPVTQAPVKKTTAAPQVTDNATPAVTDKDTPVVIDNGKNTNTGNMNDDGYKTEDNVDASKTSGGNSDKISDSKDPNSGATIPCGSLLATISAMCLVLFSVL